MRNVLRLFTFPTVLLPILLIMTVYTFNVEAVELADAMTNWQRSTRLSTVGGELGVTHHAMRWWGTFLGVLSVELFGESMFVYYLSPMFSMVVFLVAFSFIIERHFGPGFVALFLLFYITSPALYRQTFHALPTAYGVSVVGGAAVAYYYFLKTERMVWFVTVVVCLFAFYGTKVTNLFFMPGFGLVLLAQRRWRYVGVLVGGFIALYGVETLVISGLNGWSLPFGRIQALLFRGYAVDEVLMFDYPTDNIPLLLLMRWVYAHPLSLKFYYAFLLLAPVAVWWAYMDHRAGRGNRIDAHPIAFAAMGMSFAFFTTFFVISLDPFRLGQPIMTRYLMILLIFAVYTLMWLAHKVRLRYQNPVRLLLFSLLFLLLLTYWTFVLPLVVILWVALRRRPSLVVAYARLDSAHAWMMLAWMGVLQTIAVGFQAFIEGMSFAVLVYLVFLVGGLVLTVLQLGMWGVGWVSVFQRVVAAHLVAFILGILVSIVAFGLWLWPVWTDAELYSLIPVFLLFGVVTLGVATPETMATRSQLEMPRWSFAVLATILVVTGVAPHMKAVFPLYKVPVHYNLWTVNRHFATLAETLEDPSICLVFASVFNEPWAVHSVPGVLTTTQEASLVDRGVAPDNMTAYLIYDVPRLTLLGNSDPFFTYSPTCSCAESYYVGNLDQYMPLTVAQQATLSTQLATECSNIDFTGDGLDTSTMQGQPSS